MSGEPTAVLPGVGAGDGSRDNPSTKTQRPVTPEGNFSFVSGPGGLEEKSPPVVFFPTEIGEGGSGGKGGGGVAPRMLFKLPVKRPLPLPTSSSTPPAPDAPDYLLLGLRAAGLEHGRGSFGVLDVKRDDRDVEDEDDSDDEDFEEDDFGDMEDIADIGLDEEEEESDEDNQLNDDDDSDMDVVEKSIQKKSQDLQKKFG